MGETLHGPVSRRGFLRRSCAWGAALAAVPWLHACNREEPFDGLVVAMSSVPEGRSVRMHRDLPVELWRDGDTVRARSLLCTHQGCRVSWHADLDQYVCPCHDGRYDGSGHPVAGPPRHPLREYPVRREGDMVLVDTRVVPEAT